MRIIWINKDEEIEKFKTELIREQMLSEDLRVKYVLYHNKAIRLEKQVKLYQENYNDIDIGKMHENNQKLSTTLDLLRRQYWGLLKDMHNNPGINAPNDENMMKKKPSRLKVRKVSQSKRTMSRRRSRLVGSRINVRTMKHRFTLNEDNISMFEMSKTSNFDFNETSAQNEIIPGKLISRKL